MITSTRENQALRERISSLNAAILVRISSTLEVDTLLA